MSSSGVGTGSDTERSSRFGWSLPLESNRCTGGSPIERKVVMVDSNQPGNEDHPFDWGDAMTTHGGGRSSASEPTTASPWSTDRPAVGGAHDATLLQPQVQPTPVAPPGSAIPGGPDTNGTQQPRRSGKGLTVAIIMLSALVVAMTVAVVAVALTRDRSDGVAATADDEDEPERTRTTRASASSVDTDSGDGATTPRPAPTFTTSTTSEHPPPDAASTRTPVDVVGDPVPSASSGSGRTATDPARSVLSDQDALALIDSRVASDLVVGREMVNNRWVAQLSSKNVGTTWQGKTWGPRDIWEEFIALDDRHGALLLDSADWGFQRADLWVIVTRQSFGSGQDANLWCDDNGYSVDDCFAKLLHEGDHFSGDTLPRR